MIITKLSKVALTSTMCTSVYMSIHRIICVSMMSTFMPYFVCMHMRSIFLAKHGFQSCVVQDTLVQSGAQTSTHFFKAHISLSIIEEDVEHATCLSIEEEAIGT